jgi:hypothetical protein
MFVAKLRNMLANSGLQLSKSSLWKVITYVSKRNNNLRAWPINRANDLLV